MKALRMQCPHCSDATLLMTDRQGIEIDYCPQCRGVWLDRGELDKLLERASSTEAPAPQPAQPVYVQQPQQHHHGKPYYKHKKSWLSEIFD